MHVYISCSAVTLPGQAEELVQDGCALYDLRHPNIASIIAACKGVDNCPFLVFPYMDKLNLKLFLQNYRPPGAQIFQVHMVF